VRPLDHLRVQRREHRGDTDFQILTTALRKKVPSVGQADFIPKQFDGGAADIVSGPYCFWGTSSS
jgi:hypothetical protein